MSKHITRFFAFFFPILRRAIVEVVADEIYKIAYPTRVPIRRRNYAGYSMPPIPPMSGSGTRPRPTAEMPRPRTMADIDELERQRLARRRILDDSEPTGNFHDVLLVAFDLTGRNAHDVHTWLQDNMPPADDFHGDGDEIYLDSWWVANDERFDGTSTDSAVFVTKGKQAEARELLRQHGLVD